MAGWKAFGADIHPITATARGLEPAPALAFQVLGRSREMWQDIGRCTGDIGSIAPALAFQVLC